MKVKSIINKIKNINDRDSAIQVALDIYREQKMNKAFDKNLIVIYKGKILEYELEDILQSRIDYAMKLAEWNGELIYEEIHKLFSLCDTIIALETTYLELKVNVKKAFEEAIRKRLCQQEKQAKLVAEDRIETWNKDHWWYKKII